MSFAQDVPLFVPEVVQKKGSLYQVGDRIQLSIQIPGTTADRFQGVNIKPKDESQLEKSSWFLDPNTQVIGGTLRFVVSPLQGGTLSIPELMIQNQDSKTLAKIASISVEVAKMEVDPAKQPELIDAQPISLPKRFIVYGIAVLVFFCALFWFLYRKFKHRFKPAPKPVLEVKLPPTPDHVIALRDLEILYEQNPYSVANLKPIAFGVSQILKVYFSNRFKIDASESTTAEMIALIAEEGIKASEIQPIRDLFEKLDLIKFTEVSHHQHFQKADYVEFKDIAKRLIDQWAHRLINNEVKS